MTPDEVGTLVGQVGFPIVVAVFTLRWIFGRLSRVLDRMNGKMDRLADAVERNTHATEQLCDLNRRSR